MKKLLDSTRIENMILKNRFIRSATGDTTDQGHINEKNLKLYEDLAKGGVGTIITGFTLVDDLEKPFPIFCMYDDSFIEEYKKLTDIVHEHGTNIILQLVYVGSSSSMDTSGWTVLGPSAVANLNTKITPKEMNLEEITDIQKKFAVAALRAKKAGFDGVELHAAHGFLLNQFISPYYNRRSDNYGGAIENRARMTIETYSKVREAVGKEYPVWVKINSSDGFEGGMTFDDCRYVCKKLAELGVNAIEISGNWIQNKTKKEAYFKEETRIIAEENNVPVVLVGGNRDFDQMEQLLNDTKIEYFGMSRPFIAEPGLVNRYINENIERVKCVSCNSCLGGERKCVFSK